MTRIAHLSDLHFGRDRPELVGPLIEAVNASGADLVALSGDLTQRARLEQFRAARAFLDRLAPPWIAVPGNHDIPLHDPVRRLLHPFHAWRRWIGANLEPRFDLHGVRVVGLNTATPFEWQRGWARHHAVARACRRLSGSGSGPGAPRFRVVLAHHPFSADAASRKAPMRGAARALDMLSDCGVQVVLSGHLHRWRSAPFVSREGGARVLEVHAGTGISTRIRNEPNDFALLDFDAGGVTVTRMAADGAPRFAAASRTEFRLVEGHWLPPPPAAAGGGKTFSSP